LDTYPRVFFLEADYEKGMKISDEQKEKLITTPHSIQPKRNYTLLPEQSRVFGLGEISCQRTNEQDSDLLITQKPEVIFA